MSDRVEAWIADQHWQTPVPDVGTVVDGHEFATIKGAREAIDIISPPESRKQKNLKRTRSMSSDNIETSQKRARLESDRSFLASSDISTSSDHILNCVALRPPSSRSSATNRATSATRILLKHATPSIVFANLAQDQLTEGVAHLWTALNRDFSQGFIPHELKAEFSQDSYMLENFRDLDFVNEHYGEARAHRLFGKVRRIRDNATICKLQIRDENAWCLDVVLPLLKLAIKECSMQDEWLVQSVQSQRIERRYMTAVFSDSTMDRITERRLDFALSYSHENTEFLRLYNALQKQDDVPSLSHTTDVFTKSTLLFSGIEVKTPNARVADAELQLGVWLAASLRKKRELCALAGPDVTRTSSVVLPEPAIVVAGHDHKFFIGRIHNNDNVVVLGPDAELTGSTQTIRSTFKLLETYKRILRYGQSDYFKGNLLQLLRNMSKSMNAL